LLIVGALALGVTACGAGEPEVTEPVVTTPQAALDGEWVLTRTVTASDDPSNPEREVGAVTTRLVSIIQEPCETALCPGTVSSGATVETRQTTDLTQVDGGTEWTFAGFLDCLNDKSGLVQIADAFEFTQFVSLTVASKLEGTMVFSDSLTLEAHKAGCKRDPLEANVEYSVSAVRAGAEEPAIEE
jgi:hypothetical protein